MRIGIVTLGCDKNTVDNEYLAGLLDEAGCELVALPATDPALAAAQAGRLDAAVVTTCGFIDRAKAQSVDSIVQLAESKRGVGNPRRLFVAGCLSQRYGDELMTEIPEVDAMVGVGQFARLAELILEHDHDEQRRAEIAPQPTVDIYKLMRRRRLEATPHAFLKVSDGCNHTCTFCSIPSMKGKLRSVPREILIEEARRLIGQGVRELNLVAQDLSMYGIDRWPDYRLPDLLRDLCAIPGDFWIRCLYYYPGLVTDDFLDVMASEPKIIPYLDMPLQHLDPGVLRRMKRPFHDVKTFRLVERMRERVPGLVLRSTMIVGFPGETRAEHEAMLEGIRRLRIDRLGAFEYSVEEGTPAGEMEDQLGARERKRRWRAVMETQQPIAAELGRARIGSRVRVLVEGLDPESNRWVARSTAEAPEIDGKVLIDTDTPPAAGEFLDVEITDATVYDVLARPLAKAASLPA